MLAIVEFEYSIDKYLDALTREDYNELAQSVPQLRLEEWKEDAEKRPYWYERGPHLIDLQTDGPELTRRGIQFRIVNFKGSYMTSRAGKDSNAPNGPVYNMHIAIPNVGLLTINEVQLMEDACTYALQGELDDGWRIIAVCPPNSVRRPTYILGRTKTT